VNYLVKQQYLAAEQASKLAVLYSQAIVPQSSQTLESSELAYQTGQVDFLTMLDNFINLLDFQVNYYHQISNYQIALARLEPLVGVELGK
jgi:outer membrane protein TolC